MGEVRLSVSPQKNFKKNILSLHKKSNTQLSLEDYIWSHNFVLDLKESKMDFNTIRWISQNIHKIRERIIQKKRVNNYDYSEA
jgi:hypothetical protein